MLIILCQAILDKALQLARGMSLKYGQARMHQGMLGNLHTYEALIKLNALFLTEHLLTIFETLLRNLLVNLQEIN